MIDSNEALIVELSQLQKYKPQEHRLSGMSIVCPIGELFGGYS